MEATPSEQQVLQCRQLDAWNLPIALSAAILLGLLRVDAGKAVLGEVLGEKVFCVWGGGLAGVAIVVLVRTGHCGAIRLAIVSIAVRFKMN